MAPEKVFWCFLGVARPRGCRSRTRPLTFGAYQLLGFSGAFCSPTVSKKGAFWSPFLSFQEVFWMNSPMCLRSVFCERVVDVLGDLLAPFGTLLGSFGGKKWSFLDTFFGVPRRVPC